MGTSIEEAEEVEGAARTGAPAPRAVSYILMAPVHHSGSFSQPSTSSHPVMIPKSGSFTAFSRRHADRQVFQCMSLSEQPSYAQESGKPFMSANSCHFKDTCVYLQCESSPVARNRCQLRSAVSRVPWKKCYLLSMSGVLYISPKTKKKEKRFFLPLLSSFLSHFPLYSPSRDIFFPPNCVALFPPPPLS